MSNATPDLEAGEHEIIPTDAGDASTPGNPQLRLTLGITREGRVTARPYDGTQEQSFNVVDQADGSKGIRCKYYDLALGMTANGVNVRPYDGSRDQSFTFVGINNGYGSTSIRCKYDHNIALAATGTNKVYARPYEGKYPESFNLHGQADGSTGIRSTHINGSPATASEPATPPAGA
ncbi:RICIN domain-containing protein [Nocardia exalbida]|uniref:RICIN domain-containing protein n=1 Tax=Nocardia exalbida TaxID=290231 RepID=UPI0005943C9D|nr:hypothetical protein [Nocardia exalbida]